MRKNRALKRLNDKDLLPQEPQGNNKYYHIKRSMQTTIDVGNHIILVPMAGSGFGPMTMSNY